MTKKTTVTGTSNKAASKGRAAVKETMAENGPVAPAVQLKMFEQAVALFSQRKFSEALICFQDSVKGPARDIADKARSYAQVCERRITGFDLQLHTAEDHFNYGVERLNARDIERAKDHLSRALALTPDADHVHFTMALCCGLSGDGNGACENLKRAIDIEPRNRILARQDPEFTALAQQIPGLRALLAVD
jgi:tetratricopeptide (TPR) repeat protein